MEKTKGNTNSPDIYNSFRLKKLKVVFGEKREEKMQGKEISVYCMEKSRLGTRKQNICWILEQQKIVSNNATSRYISKFIR